VGNEATSLKGKNKKEFLVSIKFFLVCPAPVVLEDKAV